MSEMNISKNPLLTSSFQCNILNIKFLTFKYACDNLKNIKTGRASTIRKIVRYGKKCVTYIRSSDFSDEEKSDQLEKVKMVLENTIYSVGFDNDTLILSRLSASIFANMKKESAERIPIKKHQVKRTPVVRSSAVRSPAVRSPAARSPMVSRVIRSPAARSSVKRVLFA